MSPTHPDFSIMSTLSYQQSETVLLSQHVLGLRTMIKMQYGILELNIIPTSIISTQLPHSMGESHMTLEYWLLESCVFSKWVNHRQLGRFYPCLLCAFPIFPFHRILLSPIFISVGKCANTANMIKHTCVCVCVCGPRIKSKSREIAMSACCILVNMNVRDGFHNLGFYKSQKHMFYNRGQYFGSYIKKDCNFFLFIFESYNVKSMLKPLIMMKFMMKMNWNS